MQMAMPRWRPGGLLLAWLMWGFAAAIVGATVAAKGWNPFTVGAIATTLIHAAWLIGLMAHAAIENRR